MEPGDFTDYLPRNHRPKPKYQHERNDRFFIPGPAFRSGRGPVLCLDGLDKANLRELRNRVTIECERRGLDA